MAISMKEPFKVIERANKIAKFICNLNVDLVYANNHNSLAVITACQQVKIPVVYGCHGVGLLFPLKIRFLRPDDSLCYNKRSFLNCLKFRVELSRASIRKMRLPGELVVAAVGKAIPDYYKV